MKNLALFFFLLATAAFGQPLTADKIAQFEIQADQYVGFDAFGFQYFIKDNNLVKTNGLQKAEFKKISLGNLTRVDIRNPLMIVLFYQEYNTAVLVDNQLNEIREIRFNDFAAPIVAHAVGLAAQNRLWVFDTITRQLMLFDYLKNTLTPIATPFKDMITYYQTDFNHFQWIDENGNWFASDIFGKVSALGRLPQHDLLQFVSGEGFLFTSDGKLFFRDRENTGTKTIGILENSPKKFYYEAQILAIFTSSGITNYKINLP